MQAREEEPSRAVAEAERQAALVQELQDKLSESCKQLEAAKVSAAD